MSTDRPSRPQLELLSDLQVDREERAAPTAARPPSPPAAPDGPGQPRADVPARPAFELRVTPLHWSLPRLALLPGAGLALSGGPVRVAITLR